jgi:hypothetical protein
VSTRALERVMQDAYPYYISHLGMLIRHGAVNGLMRTLCKNCTMRMDSRDAGWAAWEGWAAAGPGRAWAGSCRALLSSCCEVSSAAAGASSAKVGSGSPSAEVIRGIAFCIAEVHPRYA